MSISDAEVEAVWAYVHRTCPKLLELFESLDLRLSADRCAAALHLRSGATLERWLQERRLPRYRNLRNWYYLSLIRVRAESKGSLAAFAKDRGDNASVLYRIVERIGGVSWTSIAQLNDAQLRRRCVEVWVAERQGLGKRDGDD
jgi:hypothetical protein